MDDLAKRAAVLLENTKRLRFFKGQHYDQDADDYLRELHAILAEIVALGQRGQGEKND